jgi:hypothetical protein
MPAIESNGETVARRVCEISRNHRFAQHEIA